MAKTLADLIATAKEKGLLTKTYTTQQYQYKKSE